MEKPINYTEKLNCLNQSLKEDVIKLETVVCYVNIFIMIFGITVNIISILVFSRNELRKRKFNWYLLALTIAELIFCLIVFTDYIFSAFHHEQTFLHALNKVTNGIIDFIVHSIDSYATILTLLLSLDRLYAIKRPMKIKQFFTNLHAKKMMAVSLTLVILLKVVSHVFCALNIGGNFYIMFCSLGSPLIFNFVPLFLILILNIWLVKEIISYVKKQSRPSIFISQLARKSITEILSLEEQRRGHASTTIHLRNFGKKKINKTQKSHYIVILVHSIWSILATTPYYSLNPYISLYEFDFLSNNFDSKNIIQAQVISSLLFNSNHCFNFFIYFCFYSVFRKT